MGVLPCCRLNCEHIMCDRYSSQYGYLCYECFEELVSCGLHQDIEDFLESPKKEDNHEATYTRFNNIFSLR